MPGPFFLPRCDWPHREADRVFILDLKRGNPECRRGNSLASMSQAQNKFREHGRQTRMPLGFGIRKVDPVVGQRHRPGPLSRKGYA